MKYTYLLLFLILCGCGPTLLKAPQYQGTTFYQSDTPVQLSFDTTEGAHIGMTAIMPGSSAPVSFAGSSTQAFGVSDQKLVADSIAAEISKAGIFRVVPYVKLDSPAKYTLHLVFEETVFSQAMGTYKLKVKLLIMNSENVLETFSYDLKDTMSFKNHMLEGDPGIVKNRIATKLLEKIITDVDEWASNSQ